MFCKNCNNKLNEGSQFCRMCGQMVDASPVVASSPIVEASPSSTAPPQNSTKKYLIIIAASAVVIVIAVFFVAKMLIKKNEEKCQHDIVQAINEERQKAERERINLEGQLSREQAAREVAVQTANQQQRSTVISPTAMNVLYIGVDNPISISMAGIAQEQINASIGNGTIVRQGGQWVARPTSPGRTRITATATSSDGRNLSDGMDFRVMTLPDPRAEIGGRHGGDIERNVLVNQVGITASMGSDFLFDVRYSITRFTVEIITPQGIMSETSNSAAITQAQKELINRVSRGQRVIFTGIRAQGPDGARNLSDITFKVQ